MCYSWHYDTCESTTKLAVKFTFKKRLQSWTILYLSQNQAQHALHQCWIVAQSARTIHSYVAVDMISIYNLVTYSFRIGKSLKGGICINHFMLTAIHFNKKTSQFLTPTVSKIKELKISIMQVV